MGCCGVTYEEDVDKELSNYVKSLNISDDMKKELLKEIKEDKKKRAFTDKNFNPRSFEDVKKTVNYYKNYISQKIKDTDKLKDKDEKDNIIQNKKENYINKEIENNTIERNELGKNKNDNNSGINKEKNDITDKEPIKFNNKNNDNHSIDTEIIAEKNKENNQKKENAIKEMNLEKEEIEIKNGNEIKEYKKENEIKDIKEENEIKELKEDNKEIIEKEDKINWRALMTDNNNFSQEIPFDFQKISFKLQKASETPDKLNPFYTISAIFDFTKIFKKISSALSMGFSDITEKCGIMRQKFETYPEATDIQNLLQIEMNLNLHKLNKDNNKKLGHGNDEYKTYISACRTFLRLLWFLEYLIDVFENVLKDDGTGPIKTILGNSYDKVLAPHHSFVVKRAVGFALMFSSAGNVAKNVDIIFGYQEYNDEARKAIKDTVQLMKIIWKGGNDFYEKHDLLGLE